MTAVTVNGGPWESPPAATVADVVSRWCPSTRGIAVACNGEVVPRGSWADTAVRAGDQFEIVTAAAGG